MKQVNLAMTAGFHDRGFQHLFPGDMLETAGILLCNRGSGKQFERLLATDFICLPHDLSERKSDFVSWPFGQYLTPQRIEAIDRHGQSIFTVHSHPNGCKQFSEIDDANDCILFSSIHCWFDDARTHGAAIMTPKGEIIARAVNYDGNFRQVKTVSVVGDEILVWKRSEKQNTEAYHDKMSQTFGRGTLDLLRSLRVGVIGCSGTGSIVIELLVRNCVGELVIVDNDILEEKNLNRIVNGTALDAREGRPKVDSIRDAVKRMGLDTEVHAYRKLTDSPDAVAALVDCDALFGCVDSAFGRYHLDCLASAYLIPYFDVGVHIEADGTGGIDSADAVSHYVHPEGRSLLSRGAYTMEQVMAENWRRTDPAHYRRQRVAGYLAAVGEEQPAVMSVNMQAACMAFNDFMARIHAYRFDGNREFGVQRFRLAHGCYENESDDGGPHPLIERYKGAGDASLLVRNNTKND